MDSWNIDVPEILDDWIASIFESFVDGIVNNKQAFSVVENVSFQNFL